jgi:hypothetical protein
MKSTSFYCIVLGVALFAPGNPDNRDAHGGYLPRVQPDSLSITDLVLIYQGGTHRPDWTVDQLLPYVSYVDRSSDHESWLFDGFLFIEYKDNRGFEFAHGYKQRPARKEEWSWLLDRNFEPSHAIEALDKACAGVASRIGKPHRTRKVVLTLPEPIIGQQDWGDLGGKHLDFNLPEDRIAACSWYIDEALERWRRLSPANLELAGFYWVAEYGSESREILPRIAKLIHSGGKQFYWIPYWNAPLAGDWRSLGFDKAYQQPNHFFHPEVADSRLDDACAFARSHSMGLEMELDGRVSTAAQTFRPRFYSYLEFFKKNSVIDSSAIAYYEGGGVLLNLAKSRSAEERALYDALASILVTRQQKADLVQPRR